MDKNTINKLAHDFIGQECLIVYDIAFRVDGEAELEHIKIAATSFIDVLEYVKRQVQYYKECGQDVCFEKVEELNEGVSIPYEVFASLEKEKKKWLNIRTNNMIQEFGV